MRKVFENSANAKREDGTGSSQNIECTSTEGWISVHEINSGLVELGGVEYLCSVLFSCKASWQRSRLSMSFNNTIVFCLRDEAHRESCSRLEYMCQEWNMLLPRLTPSRYSVSDVSPTYDHRKRCMCSLQLFCLTIWNSFTAASFREFKQISKLFGKASSMIVLVVLNTGYEKLLTDSSCLPFDSKDTDTHVIICFAAVYQFFEKLVTEIK